MNTFFDLFFYFLLFLSLYVQVFFLITFLENRRKIVTRTAKIALANYPKVTITVPCWNEESTIEKTVHSLLGLNYPKDKLEIFLVDDGSQDNTWNVLQKFTSYSNIKVFRKENGGKHTALNLGLDNSTGEYFGCLDADSIADPESLIRIMSYFEKDQATMAVAPSIIVNNPKTIIQKAQKAEYDMAVYVKKMLAFLGAIHVTPGPLTIFKIQVFKDLGQYRKAHNTEDMEIAYRMQTHGYKIEQCNDAYVYTNTPPTVKKLYKQRIRWIYGFINNTIDYRKFLFKKKYGHFSTFTVPSGIISIMAATYVLVRVVSNLVSRGYDQYLVYRAVGLRWPEVGSFDPFFINTSSLLFISVVLYSLIFFAIWNGGVIARDNKALSWNVLYFMVIYSVVAPFWLMKAVYNTIVSKKPAWR